FWKRRLDTVKFPVERRLYRTEEHVQVLVESQRPAGGARGEIVMVHGLEGSGEAGYMLGLSQAGLEAGFAVHRFHMRTCGGTERLANTLYHSGLTSDLEHVLREFAAASRAPAFLVGFSLGGNVVLKLAGELGERARGLIAGVCAISAPIDLAVCSRRLGRWDNRIYEWRFVLKMRQRVCSTGRYSRAEVASIRSVFQFDERITAPAFGFHGAMEYYATQSAARFLDSIRVPAIAIHARDDTVVPVEVLDHAAFRTNPRLARLITAHGGHLGFLARARPHFWVESAIMEWVIQISGTNPGGIAFFE
ncbi:MAG: alpha/beta fold hydrolase, partial [Acidobacteria bacterium]|nr:alpha/beta fold hydrolase [Acidobacteriota bacterium]